MIIKGNRSWKVLSLGLLTISLVAFLYFEFSSTISSTQSARYEENQKRASLDLLDPKIYNYKKKYKDYFDDLDLDREVKKTRNKKKRKKDIIIPDGPVILTQKCPNITKPQLQAKDTDFQLMPERQIYVYSAYYDVRDTSQRAIRVSGFSPRAPIPFYCQLYYPGGAVYSSRGLAFDFSSEKEKARTAKFNYKSHWYVCDEPLDKEPIAVSLTPDPCVSNITNLVSIQIRKRKPEADIPKHVLVCVKTLYNFKSPYRMIEFLEYQKLFGATHVAIYDYDNPSEKLKTVIKYYTEDGFIKTVPWKLPLKTNKHAGIGIQIRTYGQRTQINDCIYRFMDMYKYIVVIDMDEFLVPVKDGIHNYTQLVHNAMEPNKTRKKSRKKRQNYNHQNGTKSRQMTSVVIPHVDFCLSPEEAFSVKPNSLLFQIYSRSLPPLESHDKRTKSIVNPRMVIAMDEHKVGHVLRHHWKRKAIRVSPSVALLHHYRQHPQVECIFEDKSVDRYKTELIKAVNNVCTSINIQPWTIN